MSEEKGEKAGAPEQTEYEGRNLMENSSQTEPGGEEVRDITVDHVMNLERGNMMDNFLPSGGLTCDITIDQGKMEADIGVRNKGTALIVGSNHKFTTQSRYLSSSLIGSCHDSCKARYKRESMTKVSPVSEMIRRARLMRTQSDLSKSAPKEETKKKTVLRQLSLPSSIEEEEEEEEEEDGGVASVPHVFHFFTKLSLTLYQQAEIPAALFGTSLAYLFTFRPQTTKCTVKQLTDSIELICDALRSSNVVEVQLSEPSGLVDAGNGRDTLYQQAETPAALFGTSLAYLFTFRPQTTKCTVKQLIDNIELICDALRSSNVVEVQVICLSTLSFALNTSLKSSMSCIAYAFLGIVRAL